MASSSNKKLNHFPKIIIFLIFMLSDSFEKFILIATPIMFVMACVSCYKLDNILKNKEGRSELNNMFFYVVLAMGLLLISVLIHLLDK